MSDTDDGIIYEAIFELSGSTYRLVRQKGQSFMLCDYEMYKDGEQIAVQNIDVFRDGGSIEGQFAPDPNQKPLPPPRTTTGVDSDGNVTESHWYTFRAEPLEFYIPQRQFPSDDQPTIGAASGTLISWRQGSTTWTRSP